MVGVDDVALCGRPLRAAVFLSRSLGRPLVLVHVRRRGVPMVEGYVPDPGGDPVDDEAENAIEAELSADLASSGDLAGVDLGAGLAPAEMRPPN